MAGELTIVLNKEEAAAVEKWLSEMGEVDKDAAISNALKSGAKEIEREGKLNLARRNKVKTGNLRRSFTIKAPKRKGYALAGFRRSAPRKGIVGGNHAHLVDSGTRERWTKKGRYTGSVSKGRPLEGSRFWRDAVETQGPNAIRKLIDTVYETLQSITQKNSK